MSQDGSDSGEISEEELDIYKLEQKAKIACAAYVKAICETERTFSVRNFMDDIAVRLSTSEYWYSYEGEGCPYIIGESKVEAKENMKRQQEDFAACTPSPSPPPTPRSRWIWELFW